MENDGGSIPTPSVPIEIEVEQVKKSSKNTPIKSPRWSPRLKETTGRPLYYPCWT